MPAREGEGSVEVTVLKNPDGLIRIFPASDGKCRITVEPQAGRFVPGLTCVTSYPLDLIEQIHAAKGIYTCNEILREEDPGGARHFLYHDVLSYLPPEAFAGKRVLDFGCGSGASTMALFRAVPAREIVGIDLEEKLLRIARLRAQRFGAHNVTMLRSPNPDSVPEGIGKFHYVMFSAVYEHLLPHERRSLLPLVWRLLEPGGVLFLNQTPYRYSPIDVHTTRLPLINYLPAPVALRYARRFSRCVTAQEDWPTLLRRGIRGATVKEIMRLLREHGEAELLRPMARVGDRIDLWFNTLSPRKRGVKRTIWASLNAIKVVTGAEVTPTLSLAIRKGH